MFQMARKPWKIKDIKVAGNILPIPTHVDVRLTWLNLSFPWLLRVNEKKIDKLGDLPRFSWEEKVGHDIIGQGTFGPFFVTN